MANASTNTDNKARNDDYDPHEHRHLPKGTNNLETLMHLIKCCLGTGILAIPQGFTRAGLLLGGITTLVVGTWMTYCLHILIWTRYETCKMQRVPILSYQASIKTAIESGPPSFRFLGKPLAVAVDIFLVVSKLGTCCVYIVFISENLKKIVDPYYPMPIEHYMLILLVPLVIFNLIPTLKLLAPFTTFANAITFLGVFITIYFMLTAKKHESTYSENIVWWGSYKTFPLYFGTILFALASVSVVVSLEMNMKHPKAFVTHFGVLNIGMGTITVLYAIFGTIGYLYCKSDCSDSITLDLPTGTLARTVQIIMIVAIFISYGLHYYVPVEVLWDNYILPRLLKRGVTKTMPYNYLLRITMCTLTFFLSFMIPRLSLFISLFGAFSLSTLGLCFPALMEYCVRWPDMLGRGDFYKYKDLFLFMAGLIGLIGGSYVAMLNIILSLLQKF